MRRTRRGTQALAVTFAGFTVVAGVACVIADPPTDVPVAPTAQPWLVEESASPPVSAILQTWPPGGIFSVPVVEDPSVRVQYRVFVDITPGPSATVSGTLQAAPEDDAGARVLQAQINAPADLNACHTIQLAVALDFSPDTFDDGQSDSVTWFYSPSGSILECPIYDAGPYDDDAGSPDATADSSVFIPPSADDAGDQ